MATPQLSPGVLVREVDLTVGRADNVLDNIGAIAGPFAIGPIDDPIDITTEQELINVFGKSISTDAQYEYWMSASSFLTYGGVLKVVRTDNSNLKTANAGVGIAYTDTLKIKNFDDYESNYADDIADYVFAAKNPGSWANNLKVCMIDDLADQTIGIATTNPGESGVVIGYGVTTSLVDVVIPGTGSTSTFTGYIKGIITGVTTDATSNANSTFDVKIISRVSTAATDSGTEYPITYAEGNSNASFQASDTIGFINNSGISTGNGSVTTADTAVDWYDQQTLDLTNTSIFWRSIAPKPITNGYVSDRSGKNDALHIVVVDDTGDVTGIQGNLLEKHLNLSKASDAVSDVNSPQKNFWKDYIALYSNNLYVGDNPSSGADTYNGTVPRATGFSSGWIAVTESDGLWNMPAQGTTYSAIGNVTYTLDGGVDYDTNGKMKAELGDLFTSYNLFSNAGEIEVDYLIMGPGLENKFESQAKANHLISIAGQRKDCIAVISPHRADIVNVTNSDTQTDNIIEFFSPLSSSSYAIFDSGYKYTYDRFNNKFRYIPCNADVAGLCVRTSIFAYPWFSPAGQQRGVLNGAIKLAYNINEIS